MIFQSEDSSVRADAELSKEAIHKITHKWDSTVQPEI